MNRSIGPYINELITRAGLSQSDVAREIKVSRQLLNCIICGKREMSLQLAMKLESFFSLPDGELMKMQALQAVRQRKQSIRNHLCKELVSKNAFWSYDVKSFESIPDAYNELFNRLLMCCLSTFAKYFSGSLIPK